MMKRALLSLCLLLPVHAHAQSAPPCRDVADNVYDLLTKIEEGEDQLVSLGLGATSSDDAIPVAKICTLAKATVEQSDKVKQLIAANKDRCSGLDLQAIRRQRGVHDDGTAAGARRYFANGMCK